VGATAPTISPQHNHEHTAREFPEKSDDFAEQFSGKIDNLAGLFLKRPTTLANSFQKV
jgi:hypothetical protein